MAKNKVSEWSATPANNTDIGGIDIAEGCAPAGINNAIRELMSQVKDMQAGTDSDNFTVGGNLTVTGTAQISGGITGALSTTGNTTLGDASTDTLTINGTSVSVPNNLNIDSNTLFIDATNNRVGVGKNNPATALDINGTVTATAFTGNLTGNVTGNVTGDVSGNAGTVTNGVYTSSFTGANQSLVANGYQKLVGGLILQWGTATSNSDDAQVVNLPTSFTTSCLFAVATFVNVSNYPLPVTAKSTTTITVDRNTNVDGSQDFMFFALGY